MQILIDPRTVYYFVYGLLNAVIAVYFVVRPPKTKADRLLIVVFGLWAVFWLVVGIAEALVWGNVYAFSPLRYPFMLGAVAVLVHFAYAFRGNPYRREARVVLPVAYGLALLLSAHPTWASVTGLVTGFTPPPFTWWYLRPDDLNIAFGSVQLVWIGATLLLLWSVAVFVRKSVRSTREATGQLVPWLHALLHPVGREARAQRAFLIPWLLIVLITGFAPFQTVLQLILVQLLPGLSPILIALVFGVHSCAFVLVYLTYAPEPTSMQVKLSGAALIVTLGVFTALFLAFFPDVQYRDYDHEEYGFPEGETLRFTPRPEGGYAVERLPLPAALDGGSEDFGERLDSSERVEGVPIAIGFAFPFGRAAYDTLFVRNWSFLAELGIPEQASDLQELQGVNPRFDLLSVFVAPPAPGTLADGALYAQRETDRLTVTWHEVLCCGQIDRSTVQFTLHADGAFAYSYVDLASDVHPPNQQAMRMGFHPGGDTPLESFRALLDPPLVVPAGAGLVDRVGLRYRTMVHERMVLLFGVLLLAVATVLVGFPLLLRTSLTAPIARLLAGIRRIDAGERDVAVPVGAEDEVGRLTRYFNRMTDSLKAAEADLRAHAETLEERVTERTAELQAEKEKTEAQAEALAAQAEELTAQAEQLREMDVLKSRFFANVSHELRTPLTLLLGPVKDALDAENEHAMERLQKHLPIMERNGERLLALVGQLLDLARLEGGGMHLHAREFDLVPFVGVLADSFAGRAERLGLSLVFDPAVRSLPCWADPDKLEKVVTNLLSNALKFTPARGKVRVRVGRQRDQKSEYAEVSVQDTGPGIPAAELPHIFDRFHQVDGSATRTHEGAGIGLALARELVELHHGTLAVESTEGFGSTFSVRLPLGRAHLHADEVLDDSDASAPPTRRAPSVPGSEAEVEEPKRRVAPMAEAEPAGEETPGEVADEAEEEVPEEAPEAPLVLVVEDNADMRAYLRSLLEPTYRVAEAAAGDAGLAAARRLASEGIGPDLVLSDVMMPGVDGLTLCQALKADERLGHVPVVLLTARADEGSRLEGLHSGADAYLAKPFSAEELMTRAENLIALRRRLREHFGGRVVVGPTEVEVPSAEAAWVGEARDVVEAHLADTTFSVDRLADELAMSTRQLQRRMKEAAGLTPHGFIRMLRLERAARLLKQRAGGVADVAYAVGYQTPDYFSRQFREVFGVPPSAYAEEAKE